MADTKNDRDKQAHDQERRQRERAAKEARARADEPEPPVEPGEDLAEIFREETVDDEEPPECRRRGCSKPATFVVLERYQEDTGHGAVEAAALLCLEHTAEEYPTNLDGAYDDYVFRIEPL